MRLRRLINIEQGLLDPPDDLGYRRRVLEDARAKKRRFDPLRSQRRYGGKMNRWSTYTDQWRMRGMIVVAGSDHCHRAIMLEPTRILVETMVQLRGSTQRERPEKSHRDKCRDKYTPAICRVRERAHSAATFSTARFLRKRYLYESLPVGAFIGTKSRSTDWLLQLHPIFRRDRYHELRVQRQWLF